MSYCLWNDGYSNVDDDDVDYIDYISYTRFNMYGTIWFVYNDDTVAIVLYDMYVVAVLIGYVSGVIVL